jgi:hypothetical protein
MKSVRHTIVEQVLVSCILNFLIAYGISSLTLAKISMIPMHAPSNNMLAPNMAGDILVGTFLLGLLLTLILTSVVRMQHKSKPIDFTDFNLSNFSELLPKALFKRSIIVGLASVICAALPLVIALSALSIQQMASSDYILYHAIYVACVATIMAYFVTKRAILDVYQDNQPASI